MFREPRLLWRGKKIAQTFPSLCLISGISTTESQQGFTQPVAAAEHAAHLRVLLAECWMSPSCLASTASMQFCSNTKH